LGAIVRVVVVKVRIASVRAMKRDLGGVVRRKDMCWVCNLEA
jgi:hypothetical protein